MAGEKLIVFICVLIGALASNNIHKMQVDLDEGEPLKLTKFKVDNCSIQTKNLIYFEELNVTPDPIKFGSTEKVSVVLEILKTLGAPGTKLSAKLELYGKSAGQWMDYCPLIGEENCRIDDLCTALKKLQICPLSLIGLKDLGCSCPFSAKRYANQKDTPVQIPSMALGIAGTFNVTLTLMQEGQPIGCTSMVFCLNKCSQI